MNPELQKAIGDIITVVKDGAQFAAATAGRELPLLVQEYLRWGVASATMGAVGGVVLLLVAWRLYRFAGALPLAKYDMLSDGAAISYILTLVPGVVGCFAVTTNVYTLVQILVAPRVYLLETLTGLVK